jgi:carbamoyltransferase
MRVLGLSFSGHGSAICLVEDGRVVAAVNLERLSRTKFALATVPGYRMALAAVLKNSFGYDPVPPIADFYEAFPAMLQSVCGESELGKAGIDLVVKTHDNIRPIRANPAPYDTFCEYFGGTSTFFDLEHHLGHAYQAYFASPWDNAAVLTIDGRGEHLERLGGAAISTSLAHGVDGQIRVLDEVRTPASVGAMYAAVTSHLGFREEQEGNTMALAAFGTDRFYRQARESSIRLLDGGQFELPLRATLDGFNYLDEMQKFCPAREAGSELTQDHYDLAWGFQKLAEEIIVHVTRALHDRTGSDRLAVAGGVALNCVANTKVLQETPFREMYIFPNAGDRGLAVGAALYGYHAVAGGGCRHPVAHDYLGRAACEAEIVDALGAASNTCFKKSGDIAGECAARIAAGQIIGWVQGGAEFGPRALGHRSILADPRTTASKERLDREIKRREWFRPYAPSVLAEFADEYFEMLGPSPYMLLALNTRPEKRCEVPGIVHADGSARVQTVEREIEPLYHRLISKFHEITGVPMVMNTSFNGYGEPMIETPRDAVEALHSMGLDALAIGDYLVLPAAPGRGHAGRNETRSPEPVLPVR